MATKAKPITSNRDLARHCGRSHTTVARWRRHPEWKWGSPPWSLSVAADALEWAEITLQEDRAAEAEEDMPEEVAAEMMVRLFPEMHDAQYRRELNAWLNNLDTPMPDGDGARNRVAAAMRRRADELERELA